MIKIICSLYNRIVFFLALAGPFRKAVTTTGYNSGALKNFLENFEESSSEKDSLLVSAHPSMEDRLNRLAEFANDPSGSAKPLFAAEYIKAVHGKI